MQYWEEMNDKYGFGDGGSVPRDAELCRNVYVRALNAVAEQKGSNVRAISFNRGGCHNPILIVMVTLAQFNAIPVEYRLSGDYDLDNLPDEKEPSDAAWEATVAECMEIGLDDYVVYSPEIEPAFAQVVTDLKAGKKIVRDEEDDEED